MICMSCESVVTALPIVSALFWPFIASVFGSEAVVRQSLVLCLYFLVCDQLSKKFDQILPSLKPLEAIIDLLILVFLFGQSFISVPTIVINVFGFLIANCEPLIIAIEVRQSVHLVTNFGQYLADCVHNDSEESQKFAYKSLILFLTATSYLVAFFVFRYSLTSAQTLLFTYAAVLLVFIEMLKIIATIYTDDGIISDPALIFLMSSLALYLSVFDDNNRNNSPE